MEFIEKILEFLRGKSTDQEVHELKSWLEEDPKNKKEFNEISDIWHAIPDDEELTPTQFNPYKALEKVKGRVHFPVKESWIYRVGRIAAIFIIAFSLGIFAFYQTQHLFEGQKESITEINAPIGSKTTLTLPDGSRVWLNSDSKITYSKSFNQKERRISLVGEAYFKVEKNKKKPFIVETHELDVNVTGTSFNLKAYPGESTVETTLDEGEVILKKEIKGEKKELVTLKPNQRAVFHKNQNEVELSGKPDSQEDPTKTEESKEQKPQEKIMINENVETEVYTSWKEEKLIFRNEKFSNLAVKLERWYGVKIHIVDNEILNYHFNGTIENETIQDVMKIIQYALPINYTIEHKAITITQGDKLTNKKSN